MLKVLQVGTGVRGARWARVVRENPDTTMVGFVSRRLAVMQARVKDWGEGDVPCYTDLNLALDETRPDILLLVTPPEVHHAQIMAGFVRDVPVLVEKPLTEEMDEAIDLVREAETRGLPLMVGMNFRYLPTHQEIRRVIKTRELGDPSFSQFSYIRHRDGNRHDLNKYVLTMHQPMLLEQSIHHLDLMRYCLDRDVETVLAETYNPPWSTYEDDSNVSLLMRFSGNLFANYMGTWTSAWNRLDFRWRIDCPQGALIQQRQFSDLYRVDSQSELALTGTNFKDEAEPLERVAVAEAEAFVDDTRVLLARFVDAVRGTEPLETSGMDHLKSLGLVFAAIEAAKTGTKIVMEEFYHRLGIPDSWL
jgi:predicted dehydrogenase